MVTRIGLGAAALMLMLLGCAAGDTQETNATDDDGTSPPPEDPPTAEEIFEDRCSSCHGSDAEGGESGPQILSPVVGYATYVVRTGRGEMGYPAPMQAMPANVLTEEALSAVIEYLRSAPKPEDGQGLYVRFCGNCHGSDAQGGRVGEGLLEAAHEEPEEFLEKVREGEGGQEYGNRTEYMPSWPVSELTDEEVAKIAAYVATLGTPPPDDGDDDDGEEDDD
ncbi:MAG: c-type cytochrome [Polyangiaceae bacterium]|nr:c-type cytochrome [Polyangiaceae bacterium]